MSVLRAEIALAPSRRHTLPKLGLSQVTTRLTRMTTALYRRYRPESFADVIGQEHVTEPLMQALRTGRVNHAYLFSGPRGCGKTTSARILARCLNCEQGPTPVPCGTCDSCVALSRGGSGSVDVIEIDAASHGGVDDARDLRERASFGPASSRYKIYIIDEAHMVTAQGFNALLKIVEEPPEHVKFIFATTEPEKVIGTIRSRTHHYPFRLVPPKRLADYMETLLAAENVSCEPGVLSFVTRAGGGSVRDSLSILDQLIAGSGPEGLTYASAAGLLGFTDDELLDGIVDAFAAGDSAAVFRQIDKVVESGSDPRRFVEDLLERLRDLIVVAAVAEGAGAVLRGVPEDQLDRMRHQAANFGPGALSRAADVINAGLTEMSGATSPRLQLELMCARVLLPGIAGLDGYAARLDRMERRLDMGQLPPSAPAGAPRHAPAAPPAEAAAPRPTVASASTPPRVESPIDAPAVSPRPTVASASTPPRVEMPTDAPVPSAASVPNGAPASSAPSSSSEPASVSGESAAPSAPSMPQQRPQTSASLPNTPQKQTSTQQASGAAASAGATSGSTPLRGGMTTDDIRRAWPDVLDRVFRIKRVTWTLLSQNAQVLEFDGQRLVLGANSPGLAATMGRGQHPEVVRQALIEAIGVDVRVEARVMGAGEANASTAQPAAATPAPQERTTTPAPVPVAQERPQNAGQVPQQQFSSQSAPSQSMSSQARPTQSAPPQSASSQSAPSQPTRPQQQAQPQTSEWPEPPSDMDVPPDPQEFGGYVGGASTSAWGEPSAQPWAAAQTSPHNAGSYNAGMNNNAGQQSQTQQQAQPAGPSRPDQRQQQAQRPQPQQEQKQSGWRARTGWDGQQANASQAVAPSANSASADIGLATAAAQSSAWGSTSADWASQTGPAPDWASGDAPVAPQSSAGSASASMPEMSAPETETSQEETSNSASDTPDWMEDEPETDVEAVYDPLPPKESLGAAASAANGSTVETDDRALTPRQRAEKAAREAAQRAEDTKIANGGSQYDDTSVSPDDEDIENSDAVGLPVIKAVLGGTVIKEEGPESGA